ncbi:MAG: signal peptidase I [Ignavibacteriales bacterium]|nr:signal peptidase I [Ignavibacteriales bacterium]
MAPDTVKSDSGTASIPATNESESFVQKLAGHTKTVFVTIVVALLLKTFVVEAYRIPTASMENTLLVGDFLLVNKLTYGFRTPRYLPLTNVVVPSFTVGLWGRVERGDVVVFEYPADGDPKEQAEPVYFVKRCVGLPGDEVEIRKGRVSVNGKVLILRGVSASAAFGSDSYGPVTVPAKGQRIELNKKNIEQWRMLIRREGHEVESTRNGEVLIDGEVQKEYVVQKDHYFVMGDNRNNSMDSRSWGFVPDRYLVGKAILVYWSWDPDIPVNSLEEKLRSVRWGRVGKVIK